MQDVTINLTVPKELLPVLTSVVDALKKAVENDNTAVSLMVSNNISAPANNIGTYILDTYKETKPTEDEVVAYCRERGSVVDGRRFYSWAVKHDWKDAKGNPITDWRAKIAEWESYKLEKAPSPTTTKNMLSDSYSMMLEWCNE